MPNVKWLLDECLKNGAYKAYLIDVDSIPFDEKLRAYCEVNQCGFIGKNYACPPYVGEAKDLIAEAKRYKMALVYQTIGKLTDSHDFEGMEEAHRIHGEVANRISKEIALSFNKQLDLRAGPCKVCEQCSVVDNEPCRYPEKKRASLEAYCINVSSLAKKCNMKYINGTNTVSYFGAFLLDMD